MTFSKHALNRIMQRNKAISDLTPKMITDMALKVKPMMKTSGALAYVLPGLNLVLVVNPENMVVMTAYKEIEV